MNERRLTEIRKAVARYAGLVQELLFIVQRDNFDPDDRALAHAQEDRLEKLESELERVRLAFDPPCTWNCECKSCRSCRETRRLAQAGELAGWEND